MENKKLTNREYIKEHPLPLAISLPCLGIAQLCEGISLKSSLIIRSIMFAGSALCFFLFIAYVRYLKKIRTA